MSKTSVAIAICTYNRPEQLRLLLDRIVENAARISPQVDVGAVVVDDSSDGNARHVVQGYASKLQLGLEYMLSGRQNISLARNMAIEAASRIAEWTAMIDDDCEPQADWLENLLATQARTNADAVTGPMIRRVSADCPRWLTDEPFLQLGLTNPGDEERLAYASTFNSMIASDWLNQHPGIRFDPDLGVVGGEDMVFYRAACAAGLKVYHSKRAAVFENQPASRTTFAFQLRAHFWHGNSAYIASLRSGHAGRARFFLHGVKSLAAALPRPFVRLCRGQRPQMRYWLASILLAAGKMSGPLGLRVAHK